MKAAIILRFGPPDVIVNDDLTRPQPGSGQLLVQVKAAGVGPWDALIREGKSVLTYHDGQCNLRVFRLNRVVTPRHRKRC